MLPFWAVALLGFLVVARATRFVNSDYLAADFRDWVRRRFGAGKIYYLIKCPWCASIWIAAPVAAGVAFFYSSLAWPYSWLAFLGLWLGYSYVYGLLASNLDEDE